MANSWEMRNWNSLRSTDIRKGLDTIGADTMVTIYKQPKKINRYATNVYSFPEAYKQEVTYAEFLNLYEKADFPG